MRFIVSYFTPVGEHGQKEIDAYDNIEAAQKVKKEMPEVKILEITALYSGEE